LHSIEIIKFGFFIKFGFYSWEEVEDAVDRLRLIEKQLIVIFLSEWVKKIAHIIGG
jgi:hypothetical protein